MPDEEALSVVVSINEPAGDVLGAVDSHFARARMKDVNAIDLDSNPIADTSLFRPQDLDVRLPENNEEVASTPLAPQVFGPHQHGIAFKSGVSSHRIVWNQGQLMARARITGASTWNPQRSVMTRSLAENRAEPDGLLRRRPALSRISFGGDTRFLPGAAQRQEERMGPPPRPPFHCRNACRKSDALALDRHTISGFWGGRVSPIEQRRRSPVDRRIVYSQMLRACTSFHALLSTI